MMRSTRRSFVASIGIGLGVSVSGCTSIGTDGTSTPGPGALEFRNGDDVPHVLTVRVVDGPDRVMDDDVGPNASISLTPGENRIFEDFITVSGMYEFIAETPVHRSEPLHYDHGDTDPAFLQAEIDGNGYPIPSVHTAE